MSPPQEFIDKINSIAYDFVWQSKPEKVRRLTLISNYEDGGLKMLDIKSFLQAQKAMWVKRIVTADNASWKALPRLYLSALLGNDTYKCNMVCDTQPKNFPDFYWQVLKYWFEIKDITNNLESPFNIRRESIWLNKNIKVNNKELRGAKWHNAGINCIHDILNEDGTFLTLIELENKYSIKCDFLKYNKIKDAIPLKWRTILRTMKIPNEAISFEESLHLEINKKTKHIKNITNKDLYWTLIRKKQQKPIISEKTWNNQKLTYDNWKEIFKITSVLRDTKIKTFQYKVLFNLIPCNKYLKRIAKSDTDICNACNKLDDINHYLCECQEVRSFWNGFTKWWRNITGAEIVLDTKSIILGIYENRNKNEQLNACVILAKWHIYKNKLNQEQIFFYKFLCELKYFLTIEHTIALRNNTVNKYETTWQKIADNLT
jgi:hypothetical protein